MGQLMGAGVDSVARLAAAAAADAAAAAVSKDMGAYFVGSLVFIVQSPISVAGTVYAGSVFIPAISGSYRCLTGIAAGNRTVYQRIA